MSELYTDLGKQLQDFLESGISVTKQDNFKLKDECSPAIEHQLELLSNVPIQSPSSQMKSGFQIRPKKFTTLFRERQRAKMLAGEKRKLSEICKELALDYNYILSKKDVPPWPHPKNVRYLERYRKIETLPDGTIVAERIPSDIDPRG